MNLPHVVVMAVNLPHVVVTGCGPATCGGHGCGPATSGGHWLWVSYWPYMSLIAGQTKMGSEHPRWSVLTVMDVLTLFKHIFVIPIFTA